jgi:phosphatidylserine decarboxylase
LKIASEGIRLLLPPLIILLGIVIAAWIFELALVLWIAGGCCIFILILFLFFRDPDRKIPSGKQWILSPCDGTVIVAREANNETDSGRIAVFMSIWNVHVNRNPVAGIVREIRASRGSYHHAASDEAILKNTSVTIRAETDFGDVTWIQVAGALARKISCRLQENQHVFTGERFGLIYFGSRLEVLFPSNIHIRVKTGDKVRAGETILGEVLS